jgi:hypothetical protein
MNTTLLDDIAPSLMLSRIEWILGALPQLPYSYVYTVIMHPDFDRIKSREGDKEGLFNEVLMIVRAVGEIEDLDTETHDLIELVLEGRPDSKRTPQDNRVMMGMRQHFDQLLDMGYKLDRCEMTFFKGKKRIYFRHGILIED